MTIPLYGSTGALFNRLGTLAYVIENVDSFHSTLEASLIGGNGITNQYQTEPDLQAQIGTTWINLLASVEAPCSVMQQLTVATINRMVYRDSPQYNQTITGQNLTASINYVLQQMASQNATILQMTVGATSTPFVGTGNGVINVSLKRPFDGRFLENAFQETITFTCVADSYIGGATAFNEGFQVTGEGSEPDVFAFDWPLGSNGLTQLNAINGDANQSQNNLLNNSGFALWTGGAPNNWIIVTGGSLITQNQSIIFTTGSSMLWTGDGSTLINITQTFNSSTGNNSTLSPQTQYSVNLYLRTGGAAPTQGILQIDLIDGHNNIINDQAGNPNSFTIDLTTLSTVWTSFKGFFRTPEIMPGTQSIRYHLNTALNNGAFVYFDKTSMGLATQLYSQGPFIAVHSGNTPFVQSPVADYGQAQVTNSRGAGGTLSTWQTALWRLLGTNLGFELIWPSSLSPDVSDGLIQ